MAFPVEVGEEQAGITSVQAAAGENDPASVAGPGMIAVGVFAAKFVHAPKGAAFQIHQPQIGLLVPDREGSIGRCREQQPLTINTGEGNRQAVAGKNGPGFALESTVLEADGLECIPNLRTVGADIGYLRGTAIIKDLSVR